MDNLVLVRLDYNYCDYLRQFDNKVPKICPSVCDPFKNRANKLLKIAYEIYKEDGLDFL